MSGFNGFGGGSAGGGNPGFGGGGGSSFGGGGGSSFGGGGGSSFGGASNAQPSSGGSGFGGGSSGGGNTGFGGGGGSSSFGGASNAQPSSGGSGFGGGVSGGGNSGFGGGGGSSFGGASNAQPSSGGSGFGGGVSGGGNSGFGGGAGGSSFGSSSATATKPSSGGSGFGGGSSGGGNSGFGGGGGSSFGGASNAQPSSGGSGFGGGAPGGGNSGFGGGGGSSSFGGASNAQPSSGGSGFGGGSSGGGNSGFGGGAGGSSFGSSSAPVTKPSSGGSGFGGGAGFGGSTGGGAGFGASTGGGGSGFGGGAGFGGSTGGGAGFGASTGGGGGGFGGGSSGGGGGFGGSGEASGGGGERSNACFNCKQEGHRSSDCPEPKKERSNACFNCQQEGHRSSECPEPKKERSNTCFNCKQEGHRSSDCPEPKKERKCFNCNAEGHGSTECPEPPNPDKKPASTFIPEDYEANQDALFTEHIEKGAMFDKFYDQNVELSLSSGRKLNDGDVEKVESFDELGLPALMSTNVAKAGYSKPTPIQKYAMKSILRGHDLMACSQTGSGKTAAFLLPIMSKLLNESDLSNVSENVCSPRVLILAPTRELAVQIHKEATKFSSGTVCKCEILYGGTSVRYQKDRVMRGATILVGTTGRIKHFIADGIISLEQTKYVIMDEADKMLEMGFAEDIDVIMQTGKIAPKEARQTLMFSATFSASVQDLVKTMLKEEYLMIVVDKIGAANKCITQDFKQVERRTKKSTLFDLLGVDMLKYTTNKEAEIYKQKTLVFVSSKKMADALGLWLSESGVATTTIHGDREQAQREAALGDFRRGKTPILIATAVAERGLDINGVDHVINFDMPKEIDEYVHRIGRTGRVGNAGHSTSFIDGESDGQIIPKLLELLQEAEQIVPDWLNDLSQGSFVTDEAGFGEGATDAWGAEAAPGGGGGGGW